MRVLIGADVVATESNKEYFINSNLKELIGEELIKILNYADARIFNIEAPITDKWTPSTKAGSPKANLRMTESVIYGYKALNPTVVTLANNHIMDQGETGFYRTLELLNEFKIPFAGIGKTVQEAKNIYVIKNHDLRIGFYCCAEHEFSIATDKKSGANPFDALTSLDDIYEAKKTCDYLVVLYHGGKEFYRYPTPEIQRRFRRMADKGADLIVAQHTHCIGCEEDYEGSKLVYGQGNFIFDYGDNEYWNSGMLIDLHIERKNNIVKSDIDYIPFMKKNGTIKLANSEEKKKLMDGFFDRSEKIKQEDFIYEQYKEYIKSILPQYLWIIHGDDFWFRIKNKIYRLFGRDDYIFHRYKNKKLLSVLNYIECEAHSDILINGIREKYGIK